MGSITFKSLSIYHWRQFERVEIDFGSKVTILTGRNGTGKTTVLNILAHHSAFHAPFLSSPTQQRDSLGRFTSGVWSDDVGEENVDSDVIGNISYSNESSSEIRVAHRVNVNFVPTLFPKVPVSVLNIPSHRRIPAYRKVDSIPTIPVTGQSALDLYLKELWSGVRDETFSRVMPLTRMKEALISMAAFGSGNERVAPNAESAEIFTDFEMRLKQIVPSNIGFERIIVQIPDVIIETKSGRFLIDASSGGLMSLIDMTWQITLFGRSGGSYVVVIDEPENHLHPSMQREFLPALVDAFPEAQFVVATHSPFVVSSVRDATVYAFDVKDGREFGGNISEDLSATSFAVITIPVDVSDTTRASDILRTVLGVPVSVPIWAEAELDTVLSPYRGKALTAQDVRAIHSELTRRGLSDFLPDVIAQAAGRDA